MFLTPITVQESYLTGFLTTLPLLVVVTETAGSLVETPEAGTETMPPDLVARTLAESGWMTEELVGTSEAGFLFGASSIRGGLPGWCLGSRLSGWCFGNRNIATGGYPFWLLLL